LTLATDEILSDLVPPERMASVTFLVDDPSISNVAGRYPDRIPRLRDADVERIITLAPDLVCVAPYNTADALRLLERSGLAVYRNEAVTGVDRIEGGIRRLGDRVGEPARARQVIERMEARRRALAKALRNLPRRPRVLFWSAGFTSGLDTTMDDVIREAGAVNVAVELNLRGSAEIAPERVVGADPDVILLAGWWGDDAESVVRHHAILRHLRAVREGHLLTLEGRHLTAVSQFIIEGMERLARRLHPERFPPEGRP
jgi:iron complex transport system substrate-binding protein